MKKFLHVSCRDSRIRRKLLIFMKLSLILSMFFWVISAQANGQREGTLSIKLENVSIENVLREIEKSSNYRFVYQVDDVRDLKKVSVDISDANINSVLAETLKNSQLGFEIENDYVIIRKSNTPKVVKRSQVAEVNLIEILGKVTDTKGFPLPGATILEVGTFNGVTTDTDGNFKIKVAGVNSILKISFIGFSDQSIKVENQTNFNIVLEESSNNLNEVVVTGYQTIAKEKVTGAVTVIQQTDLEKRNVVNIMDNIEGRIPGLVNYKGVTTIRGVSTMMASQSALVVVDGLPIEGPVESINPYDVESITVLKDAAATAIYGIRASNGVIVVTTKKAREKRLVVDVSSNLTFYQKPDYKYQNFMTPAQQVNVENDYYKYWFDGAGGTVADPIQTFESTVAAGNTVTPIQNDYYQLATGNITQSELDSRLSAYRKNDFAKQFRDNALRNRTLKQYNLSVRANGEKVQSNLVLNYKTDNSGIINAYDKEFNLSYRGKYDVNKWLDVSYGVNIVSGKERSHNSAFATNPFNVSPYMNLLDNAGNRAYYTTSDFNMYNNITETTPNLRSLEFNHLDELERDYTNTSRQNIRYYVNMNFKIIPGLTFNPQFQYEDNRIDLSTYSESNSYTMRYINDIYTERTGDGTAESPYIYTNLLPSNGGRYANSQMRGSYYTARAQVNYNKQIEKHMVSVVAGTEFRETKISGTSGTLFGYDDQLQSHATNTMNFGTMAAINSTFLKLNYDPSFSFYNNYISGDIGLTPEQKHRYGSAYGNVTYTYNEKYNVFGSLRKDYADLFGADPKYRGRPLWSFGLAWNVSKEDFMSNVKQVNLLKLRTTYGVTGNIDASATSVLTANSTYTNTYTSLPWAIVESPPNSQLRWEKTATTNIGVDFVLFDYRLRGTFDWYKRKGTDLFAQKRLDPAKGFTSMIINNASIMNKGVELSLNYEWIRQTETNDFSWSSMLVVSKNDNKVTSVDEIATTPQMLAGTGAFKVGYPVRSLFSYQYAGLDEQGNPQWYKADGTLTNAAFNNSDLDAIVYSGGLDPKVNLSFSNEFNYKGFSLSVFMVYYGGHYLRARPSPNAYNGPAYRAMPSYIMNSWTPENTNTDIPGFGQYYPTTTAPGSQLTYGDFLVRHGDFIKIRNIVFGYDIPGQIAKKLKVSDIKLRFQINNPKALWVNNDVNIDPETEGAPVLTSYIFGININF